MEITAAKVLKVSWVLLFYSGLLFYNCVAEVEITTVRNTGSGSETITDNSTGIPATVRNTGSETITDDSTGIPGQRAVGPNIKSTPPKVRTTTAQTKTSSYKTRITSTEVFTTQSLTSFKTRTPSVITTQPSSAGKLYADCTTDNDCSSVAYAKCYFYRTCKCKSGYHYVDPYTCKKDTKIGDRCDDRTDCMNIANSYCDNYNCKCNKNYLPNFSNTYCQYREHKIGDLCAYSTDCMNIANAFCGYSDTCECRLNYVPNYSKTQCVYPDSKIGDQCDVNTDCMNIANSYCDFSTCKCNTNYVPNYAKTRCDYQAPDSYPKVFIIPLIGVTSVAIFAALVYLFIKCRRKAPNPTISAIRVRTSSAAQIRTMARIYSMGHQNMVYGTPVSPLRTPEDIPPTYNDVVEGTAPNNFGWSLPPPYSPSMLARTSISEPSLTPGNTNISVETSNVHISIPGNLHTPS